MIDLLVRASCPQPLPSVVPLPQGVALRRARWLPALAGRLAGMGGPAAAVTLRRTIVVHPSVRLTDALVRHELEHVRQWDEKRWTFPLRYVVNHFRYGYTANPYEVAARAAEKPGGEST